MVKLLLWRIVLLLYQSDFSPFSFIFTIFFLYPSPTSTDSRLCLFLDNLQWQGGENIWKVWSHVHSWRWVWDQLHLNHLWWGWGEGSSPKTKQDVIISPYQSSLLYFFFGIICFYNFLNFTIFLKIVYLPFS